MASYAGRLAVLAVVLAIAAGVGSGRGAVARRTRGEERAVPGSELAALTTEQLIDRLQGESESGTGTGSTTWGSDFLPLGEEAQFRGGLLVSGTASAAMRSSFNEWGSRLMEDNSTVPYPRARAGGNARSAAGTRRPEM